MALLLLSHQTAKVLPGSKNNELIHKSLQPCNFVDLRYTTNCFHVSNDDVFSILIYMTLCFKLKKPTQLLAPSFLYNYHPSTTLYQTIKNLANSHQTLYMRIVPYKSLNKD